MAVNFYQLIVASCPDCELSEIERSLLTRTSSQKAIALVLIQSHPDSSTV
ncbi:MULTISPECIES: hypothetical protein [Nostoc]|uniref:Uncharacterized protein n=2 Tax=Nostoc TaxID=1177 RepID=A0ABR8I997_9NOSO|nr:MULTISPECIES: hypothetical protein [Nostoc]MBD2559284.1 hypothetical protein [Nostoc linckia FACHB-391]MBD2647434.1 hypothetical protein [Nostoc foliaceum FACHB-393]